MEFADKITDDQEILEIASNIARAIKREADSGDGIVTLGKDTHQLLEEFGEHKVTALTYVHETVVDEDYIKYEDLSKDILEEILLLAETWEAESLQTEKRISN